MKPWLANLLFPPKCHFCRTLLTKGEEGLCHKCRQTAPEFSKAKRNISLVAQWTAVWYYKDNVRSSIHRFKFGNARSYAVFYAREMAIKLQQSAFWCNFDFLTWVPVSPIRRFFRGYDQSELLAIALGEELGIPPVRLLKKVRHTRPQSNIRDAAKRRANVMNAYKTENSAQIPGKTILMVDDVITTGATAAECAKTLTLGGAKKVYLAAIAATAYDKNK